MHAMIENTLGPNAFMADPDLLKALSLIPPGEALEIGCSAGGKNSLALQEHGFKVTCFEPCESGVRQLQKIITTRALTNIHCLPPPANYRFNGSYQFICSMMTLMQYQARCVSQIITDMQAATQKEGFNLIVAPLNTSDSDWSGCGGFAFQSGELSHYYRKWHILRYDEDPQIVSWPKIDSQPASRRFARILVQKVRVKPL